MEVLVVRLKPDADLRQSLKAFTIQKNIEAGFILSAIGSLKKAIIRFADQDESAVLTNKFEIISLNGTLTTNGIHLHICVSDKHGKTIGGHLDNGCIIYTTAEIIIGTTKDFSFTRTLDPQTGYNELKIIPHQ